MEQIDYKTASSDERMDDGYQKAYVELRTVLDSAEITAVRYFMEGETVEERNRRAEEIKSLVMPLIGKLSIRRPGGGNCPEGFFFCNGCCVPYPC
jgi:hypothetical protein